MRKDTVYGSGGDDISQVDAKTKDSSLLMNLSFKIRNIKRSYKKK